MIGNTTAEYVWIVSWATILNSVGPISVLYFILGTYFVRLPRLSLYWAALETLFYIVTFVYRYHYIQRPAVHPLLTSKDERNVLFSRCLATTHDVKHFMSQWFLNAPLSTIKRENVKEWFRWAFMNTDKFDASYEEEIDSYLERLEEKMGTKFQPGRSDVKCLRLTVDKVTALHRSLIWYSCILVVDVLTHIYLRQHELRFYRASVSHTVKVLPPRPHAFVETYRSPSHDISYWYRPHTSTTELPILFLHGIGVGLYPYMQFLSELNERRRKEDGNIGILAVEILSISSRLTSPILPRAEMCQQLRDILDHHRYDKFVMVSHSYGSVTATHLLKTPDLSPRISSIILVDPISILLNQPDVAYNFTARKPRQANEWFLWYFGSKDIGVAHTLSRTFFWSENIIWKEDLLGHHCIVFLAENDSIINAGEVRRYLRSGEMIRGKNNGEKGVQKHNESLKVVWCAHMDHGQVFDLAEWRESLKREVLGASLRAYLKPVMMHGHEMVITRRYGKSGEAA